MRRWALAALLGLAACGDKDASGSGDDYQVEDQPGGQCETEGDPDCAEPLADECVDSTQCGQGSRCVAEFDGEIGYFECATTCIPSNDGSKWCTDDASCCAAEAVCTGRGFCVDGSSEETTSTGEATGLDTDADTGTESTSSDSGGSETAESSGGTR